MDFALYLPKNILERIIKIGTRGSELALWQANHLQQELAGLGIRSELVIIKTKGDQIQHIGFDKIEGKGFFTKELEEALLAGAVDLAVHSMKDLPTTSPAGLSIAGVSYREDPTDWLLINPASFTPNTPLNLPVGATVGTSSIRRKTQLHDLMPGLNMVDIRGNVPTRIQKLLSEGLDAIVLAAAGLSRLSIDLSHLQVIRFHPREFVPAPAQGVLAYQLRSDDIELRKALRPIHHPEVSACTNVERKILQLLEGGCQLPLGAFCQKDAAGNYHVYTAYAPDAQAPLRRFSHSSSTSQGLAETVVQQLLAP